MWGKRHCSKKKQLFLNFVAKYYIVKKKKVNVIITIIIEYALICLNKQGSEYARALNIPDIVHSLWSLYKLFSIC